jgi:pre-mRNA-splicing factor SPF27
MSNIDALPYYDKQVDDPGESYNTTLNVATKAAAQALIQAELRSTPQISDDDPRLPRDVEVFPV